MEITTRACQRPVAADGRNPRGTRRGGTAPHTADSSFAWFQLPLAHEGLRTTHTAALSFTGAGAAPRPALPCPGLSPPHFSAAAVLQRDVSEFSTARGVGSGGRGKPAAEERAGRRGGTGGGTELSVSVPNKHFWGQGGSVTFFFFFFFLFFLFSLLFSARLSAKTACNTHKLYAGRRAGTRPSVGDAQQVGGGSGAPRRRLPRPRCGPGGGSPPPRP